MRVVRSARRYLLGLVGITASLGLWQLLVTGPLRDKPFATVPQIAASLLGFVIDPKFWVSLGESFKVAMIGLVVSVVIGAALGVLVGQSDAAYRSSRLVVEFLKPIPPIVILPLLVLVLGPNAQMGTFLVVFGGVFVLMTQTAYGVQDVDPIALETAQSFRLTRQQRLIRLVLPTALPYVATGVRVGAGAALVIAIVSEIIGGAPGLGKDLVLAQTTGDVADTYALVAVFGILGLLLNTVLTRVERRLLFWHASVRTEEVPA